MKNMKINIASDYHDMSRQAAERFYEKLQADPSVHFGLATGGTPIGMYRHLSELLASSPLKTDALKTFNLDEYIGLPPSDPNSFYSFMKEQVYKPWNLQADQCFIPDGNAADLEKECERYEAMIDQYGIDVQLLGVGKNGHIGFNEPGTRFDALTQVVELKPSTRKANARFFPSTDDVPTHAVTMGIGSILKAKEIVLIASGEAKAEAVYALVHREQTEDWPITALKQHRNVTVIVDEAAGRLIDTKGGDA